MEMQRAYPQIHITEEALRDGMQVESADISTEGKIALLDALSTTGLKRIVIGSFVRPEYTPQMRDIDAIASGFAPRDGVQYTAVALNARGSERRAAYMPPLTPFGSVPTLTCHMCQTLPRRFAHRTREDEIAQWPAIVSAAVAEQTREAGIGLAAVFGSNFEGPFSVAEQIEVLERQYAMWAREEIPVTSVYLYDSMGWCHPIWVEELLTEIRTRWPTVTRYHVHLHDARGLAMASTWAAVLALDPSHELHLDSTLGGIGGASYTGTGRATGMVPTEDLVNMLELAGVTTGVDLDAVVRCVWMLEDLIGRSSFGRVSKAGPHPHGSRVFDPNLPLVETFDEAKHFLLGPIKGTREPPWSGPILPSERASEVRGATADEAFCQPHQG